MSVDREYLIALGFLSYVKKIVEGRIKIERVDWSSDPTHIDYKIQGLENIIDEELVAMLSVILKETRDRI